MDEAEVTVGMFPEWHFVSYAFGYYSKRVRKFLIKVNEDVLV
jgi:hypothetical protein